MPSPRKAPPTTHAANPKTYVAVCRKIQKQKSAIDKAVDPSFSTKPDRIRARVMYMNDRPISGMSLWGVTVALTHAGKSRKSPIGRRQAAPIGRGGTPSPPSGEGKQPNFTHLRPLISNEEHSRTPRPTPSPNISTRANFAKIWARAM